MKWRCPVQYKLVKDREQWIRIARPEGPFHRDYRQLHEQPGGNLRTQLRLQHRFSQASPNRSIRQRTALHRTHTLPRPSKGAEMDGSCTNDHMPPTGTRQGSETTTIPLRVLWLRVGNVERPKIIGLRNRFGSEGMDIHIADVKHATEPAGAEQNGEQNGEQNAELFPAVFDLIMLECVEIVENVMLTHLGSIRELSQAPLIVLTDNYTLDWSLRALCEGADAIFTLNTPDDIIVARSNALLRRWA